ncbi:hypothetical protein AV530_017079 [Patagioenas fasciata monilis]|uniref:Uncharacterized protein n=1 Tax=Patagioenas fasciata monilis TaxID=372326 RepID=A0A1V4J4P1_PATFA|nr:hypothetical protein AV530_017079 [Patagioenas fasciata monilis]
MLKAPHESSLPGPQTFQENIFHLVKWLLAPLARAGEVAWVQLRPALAIPLEHSNLIFSLLLINRAGAVTHKTKQKGELKTQGASELML